MQKKNLEKFYQLTYLVSEDCQAPSGMASDVLPSDMVNRRW